MTRRLGHLEFDEQQLRRLFRESAPRSQFWKVVKDELKRLNRWKNLPRGPRKPRW